MWRVIGFIVICMVSIHLAKAQYEPQSQASFDKYGVIPAYGGLDQSIFTSLTYRSQWQSIQGMPVTMSIQANMPVYKWHGGVGMQIQSHQVGAQSETKLVSSYNYVLASNVGIFSIGAQAGVMDYRLKGSELRTPDGTYIDGIIEHKDDQLNIETLSSVAATYGISGFYRNRYFEGGMNFVHVPSNKVTLDKGNYTFSPMMNIYLEAPLKILHKFKVTGSVIVQSNFVNWQLQTNVLLEYAGNLFGGFGFRGLTPKSIDSYIIVAGWKFNSSYQVAYSYDIGASLLRYDHQGSHEFRFVYAIEKKIRDNKLPKIIYNPRYL